MVPASEVSMVLASFTHMGHLLATGTGVVCYKTATEGTNMSEVSVAPTGGWSAVAGHSACACCQLLAGLDVCMHPISGMHVVCIC